MPAVALDYGLARKAWATSNKPLAARLLNSLDMRARHFAQATIARNDTPPPPGVSTQLMKLITFF